MNKIVLIRHGATKGNIKKRYIGKTDESLLEQSKKEIKKELYPRVGTVFSSPMLRCLQTATLIYPEHEAIVIEDIKECDFGDFENKNYLELSGNEDYQKWIDSGATLPFPNGEDVKDFKRRCIKAFLHITSESIMEDDIALVCHGGVIMAIMEAFAFDKKDYYSYSVDNLSGYTVTFKDGIITQYEKI